MTELDIRIRVLVDAEAPFEHDDQARDRLLTVATLGVEAILERQRGVTGAMVDLATICPLELDGPIGELTAGLEAVPA